jgi:hypothetical integral membrane protein (TIGR02206 family)
MMTAPLHPFATFGPSHLTVLAASFFLPLMLAIVARRLDSRKFERAVCLFFAVAVAWAWLYWYVVAGKYGWLTLGDSLPLNLCDWAAAAAIVAFLGRKERAFELAYFWALCGTTQGLLTPDIPYDFPEVRFIQFSVFHGGIIAGVLFLVFGMKMRPHAGAIGRVLVWTAGYAAVAGATDALVGVNYGFLRAKPGHASLYDLMPAWPYYLPVVAGLAIGAVLIFYAPFFLLDRLRRRRRPPPSKTI